MRMPEIEKPGEPVGSDSHLPRCGVHVLLQGRGQEEETRRGGAFKDSYILMRMTCNISCCPCQRIIHVLHAACQFNSVMLRLSALVNIRESTDLVFLCSNVIKLS